MHPTHIPLRLATGAYILNSGLNKLKVTDEEAEQMHGWTSSVYPIFSEMNARDFTKLLAYGEIGLGAALLLPKVPSAVAGTALAAFGTGLTGLYLKTPGMTESDGIRPTKEGQAMAKDVWLVGAGLTLAKQSVLSGMKNAAQSVADGISDAGHNLSSSVTGAVGSARGSASSSAHDWRSSAVESAHEAREGLANAFSELAETLLKR